MIPVTDEREDRPTIDLPKLVLLSDEPTPDHNADGLKMRAYAEVIAGAALGTRGPFTIGVHGKWGEGKTSVLRQARSLIGSAGEEGESAAITVWFNAWQYDHEPYPLVPLALAIAEAVDREVPDDEKYGKAGRWITLREIGAALRAVAAGLTIKTPVLDLSGKEVLAEWDRSSAAEVGASLGSSVYQRAFALLQHASTIGLDQDDESRRPPIVVFIDDLDRCTPERALRLLQSVRLVLSQPGFLYVLALDRDPVVHHLACEYEKLKMPNPEECARNYLDKMIQLPLWIPPHAARFPEFIDKLLGREELSHHVAVREALDELRDVLQAGTDANPRAVVRLVNSLIADRRIWMSRDVDVTAEWLGLCAISRILRDKLGDDIYHTLVRADRFCSWFLKMESPEDLERRRLELSARGDVPPSRLDAEEQKVLEPIARSATLRALLETAIGKRWLEEGASRRAIEGYLSAERRGIAVSESDGISAIEDAIRSELGLDEGVPITEAHRRSIGSLGLWFRPIADDDLEYVARLTSLTTPSLWGTQVTAAGLEHLERLTSLTTLDLRSAQITDAGLEHLKGLTSLTALSLMDTQVTDAGLEHLQGLNLLTALYLSRTRVTDVGLEHLKRSASLTVLFLSDTQVTDAGLDHLQGLTSLTTLYLGGTQVTDAGLAYLKGLTSLRKLSLSKTQVTDTGVEHLKGLTSLTTLFLSDTQVTDAGLEHLKGLTSLTTLHVWGTQVTDAGVASLRAAIPGLNVVR